VKAKHLLRYADIGRLLIKHRHVVGAGSGAFATDSDGFDDDVATGADAEELATDLEAMGPTFVKLGQVLSTRADLLPPVYLEALTRLQDKVEPIPFDDVERVVTTELGMRLARGFSEFSAEPAAAASLGQVHRARLRDGRAVAVKVQRPDIRDRIVEDMEVIDELATFVDDHTEMGHRYGFAAMVEEFRVALMAELDYRAEARNLVAIGDNLAGYERIVVPKPVLDYTTSRVLTMDWISGRNLAALGPLGRLELDGHDLAVDLFRAYLDQILIDGLFHADPHPGNVLLADDDRLALIDLGMVARVAPDTQDALIKLLLAVSGGRGGDAADVMVALGEKLDGFDAATFRRTVENLVSRNMTVAVGDVQAGAVIGQVLQAAGESGLRAPSELTMMGKALLNLDEVARILDPAFEPNPTIEAHAGELMRRKMLQSASPGNIMAAAIDAKEFAEKLPGRINRVMDALAEGQLTLNVQGIDDKELMRGVQKLANRLTTGMVVAALVIGAALIMPIDVRPKLFGYPAIAIVLFAIAAAAAGWLLVSIIISDLPQHHRRGPTGSRRRRGF
jgi:predicted unusual protein kinase regulating ubiquinone biosynthesis (AarF/ABC1/UbiB family)